MRNARWWKARGIDELFEIEDESYVNMLLNEERLWSPMYSGLGWSYQTHLYLSVLYNNLSVALGLVLIWVFSDSLGFCTITTICVAAALPMTIFQTMLGSLSKRRGWKIWFMEDGFYRAACKLEYHLEIHNNFFVRMELPISREEMHRHHLNMIDMEHALQELHKIIRPTAVVS